MKIVLLMVGALLLSSCQKDKETPQPIVITEQALNCNCANSTTFSAMNNLNGYVDLINECTGNSTRIFADEMIETSIYYNPNTDISRYCLNRSW